jgi:hypothetical protein
MPTAEGQALINATQQVINKIMGIQTDINTIKNDVFSIKQTQSSMAIVVQSTFNMVQDQQDEIALIPGITNEINALESSISLVNNNVNTVKTKVNTLENTDLSGVLSQLSFIRSDTTEIKSDTDAIPALETAVSATGSKVSAMEPNINNILTAVGGIAGLGAIMGRVENGTNTLISDMGEVKPTTSNTLNKATAILQAADTIIGILNTFQLSELKQIAERTEANTVELIQLGTATQSQTSSILFKTEDIKNSTELIEDGISLIRNTDLPVINVKASEAATSAGDAVTIGMNIQNVTDFLPGAINQVAANLSTLANNALQYYNATSQGISSVLGDTQEIKSDTHATRNEVFSHGARFSYLENGVAGIDAHVKQNLPIDLSALEALGNVLASVDAHVKQHLPVTVPDVDLSSLEGLITSGFNTTQSDIADVGTDVNEITPALLPKFTDIAGLIGGLTPAIASILQNTNLIPQLEDAIPLKTRTTLRQDFDEVLDNVPDIINTNKQITRCDGSVIDIAFNQLKVKGGKIANLIQPLMTGIDYLIGQSCFESDSDDQLLETLKLYLPQIEYKESIVGGEPKLLPVLSIRDANTDLIETTELFNDALFDELNKIKETIDITEYSEVEEPLGNNIEFPGTEIALPEKTASILIDILEKPPGIGRRFGGDEQADKFDFGTFALVKDGHHDVEKPIERLQQVVIVPSELLPDAIRVYLVPGVKARVSAIKQVIANQNP